MSLATPREQLIVQNLIQQLGSEGQVVNHGPDGDPITVRCNTYPLSAEELELQPGLINTITRRVFIRDAPWPGNQYSVITYAGETWEQVGPPVDYTVGIATRHTQVTIRRTHG